MAQCASRAGHASVRFVLVGFVLVRGRWCVSDRGFVVPAAGVWVASVRVFERGPRNDVGGVRPGGVCAGPRPGVGVLIRVGLAGGAEGESRSWAWVRAPRFGAAGAGASGSRAAVLPARSPGNRRDRLLEVRSRGLPGVLAGQVAFSWTGRGGPGLECVESGSRHASSARQNPPQLARCELSSHDVSSARQNPPQLDSCELSSHNAS